MKKTPWLTVGLRLRSAVLTSTMLLAATLTMGLLTGCDGPTQPQARLALGPIGSASFQLSTRVLAAYQIDVSKLSIHDGRFESALEGLEQGHIDIAMGFFGLPSRNIDSLQAATGDLTLLSLSDAVLDDIERHTGYRRFTIPKASYPFLKQDVQTLKASALLMANTDTISDELAYQLAKIMYEQGQTIGHSQAHFLTLNYALEGSEALHIHPGAKRFYEDQGLTVDLPVAQLRHARHKREFILGSGSQGGSYYPLGGELASLWNQFIPGINITSVATDASLENLTSLAEHKLDLGLVVNISALDAQAGKGRFAGTPVDNAAFIGQLYPEVFHIISRTGNPLSSLEQLQASVAKE